MAVEQFNHLRLETGIVVAQRLEGCQDLFLVNWHDFLPFREPLALTVDPADQGVELFLRGSEPGRLLAGADPQRLGGGCRQWGFLSTVDTLLICDGTLSH